MKVVYDVMQREKMLSWYSSQAEKVKSITDVPASLWQNIKDEVNIEQFREI